MSLHRLATDLRTGRATPREVAARSLAVAGTQESVWISLVAADVLAQRAAQLEAQGPTGKPLYGLPFAVKDNLDVRGMQTTAGCPAYAYRPAASATVVRRLEAAGALLIGKTNLDQFATGLTGTRSPYGAPPSAFDSRYVSGGSSSGSAVAVASGAVAFALGSDTAGSGRVPAALNGIVGLKPTRGIASTAGMVPACRSLDCVSVFARDAPAAGRVLTEIVGFDPGAATSRALQPAPSRTPGARLRIGVPSASQLVVGERCATAWDRAVASAFELGMEVVEVDIEPLLEAAQLLYGGPWLGERYASVGRFIEENADAVDPVVAEIIGAGARWSDADMAWGRERLGALAARAAVIWESADVLLLPTIPEPIGPADVAADPIGSSARLGTYTNFVNLLDLAAVAVPAGIDDDGMTFGATLIGPAFTDDLLLAIAARWPSLGGHVCDRVDVAVCGAHMSGLPLNDQLVSRGGQLLRATRTAPRYRLVALPGGPPARPGLIRVDGDGDGGAAIEVEVWRLTRAAAGDLLGLVPAPLAIGTVELEDGAAVRGFVCEGYAAREAEDVTAYGGWRAYLAAQPRSAALPGSATP